MATIDGSEIKNVTIDGTEVLSITMDGVIVWQKASDAFKRRIMVGDNLKGMVVYNTMPEEWNVNLFIRVGTGYLYEKFINFGSSYCFYEESIDASEVTIAPNFGDDNFYTWYYEEEMVTKNLTMPTTNFIVTSTLSNNPSYKHLFIEDPNIRPIEVGDNLSGATLYFNFPDDLHNIYNNVNSTWTVARCDGYDLAGITAFVNKILSTFSIGMDKPSFKFYDYNKTNSTLTKNISSYVLPDDIGVVTNIYKNLPLIYDNILVDTKTMLRNIEVGDDLSGKTLYFSFPSHLTVNGGGEVVTASKTIEQWLMGGTNYVVVDNNTVFEAENYTVSINLPSYVAPEDMGVVTRINTSLSSYNYIWIMEE